MPGRPLAEPPDFIIIGAQRAGTTSLFEALMSHPLAERPARRELHYFDVNYWRGNRWYERQLRRPPGRFTGESSPYYLFHPRAAQRLAATCPHVPLIVLLRDPIDRAWSQHRFNVARGLESLDFLAALDAEAERLSGATAPRVQRTNAPHRDYSYAARSDYSSQLAHWRTHVPDSNLLVIQSEALFGDPRSAHRSVLAHIGVADVQLRTPHEHGGADRLPDSIRDAAKRYFSPVQRG